MTTEGWLPAVHRRIKKERSLSSGREKGRDRRLVEWSLGILFAYARIYIQRDPIPAPLRRLESGGGMERRLKEEQGKEVRHCDVWKVAHDVAVCADRSCCRTAPGAQDRRAPALCCALWRGRHGDPHRSLAVRKGGGLGEVVVAGMFTVCPPLCAPPRTPLRHIVPRVA